MALQKLCLVRIAEHIHGYYHIYSITENEYLQRGFNLLQRFYTKELVSLLVREDRLQDKYADLLFNKYLKSVYTRWFSTLSWKTISGIFVRIGPNLETVRFNHYAYDLPWEDVFSHIPNVKDIKYTHNCNDGVLLCITKYCSRLETLNITGSRDVTDDGLKLFCLMQKGNEKGLDEQEKRCVPCPLLKDIFVFGTSIGDEGIAQLLKNVPSIEKTDYQNIPMVLYEMHRKNIYSLDNAQRYNLIYLNLLPCIDFAHAQKYDDVLYICVTVCPNLKTLYCHVFGAEHLKLCSVLSDVEDLDLCCAENSSVDVSGFLTQKGQKIKCLTLSNCSVSLSVLGQCCPLLKSLAVDRVTFQYKGDDPIPMFYNLEKFTAVQFHLSDSATLTAMCCILTSSPVLENLEMVSFNSLTPEVKTAVLKCCQQSPLKGVHFSGDVEEEFLKTVLLTCSTLKALYFIGSAVVQDLRRIASTIPNRPDICNLT